MRAAILDTTALDSFYKLNLIERLATLFDLVLIPETVKAEFLRGQPQEQRLQDLLSAFESYGGWFQSCTEYDSAVLELLKLDLDPGESEVLAQASQRGVDQHQVIIDETRGRGAAVEGSYKLRGTVRLIAELHLRGLLEFGYEEALAKLRAAGMRLHWRIANKALEDAQLELFG